MTRSDEYTANLRMLDAATDKMMLTRKEACEIIGISPPTLRKYYGEYFTNGLITKPRLADAMTRR